MEHPFSAEDIKAHEAEMKVGLVATVNEQGNPHITLISTLRAYSPTGMVWGQFAEGISKENIQRNPHTGWLILTLDKQLWRGKAKFTHTAISGPEYEFFNNTVLFRYNAYFGIHRAYYMDLVEQSGRQDLPMGQIVFAEIKSIAARTLVSRRSGERVLNDWTKALIDKLDNLKFLAYVEPDGYPVIIPLIQAQTDGRGGVVFSAGAYGDDIRRIPAGCQVSFFCMSFSMQDVVIRGRYDGLHRRAGLLCGSMSADWVYSPMPPVAGQVYPPAELQPVTEF